MGRRGPAAGPEAGAAPAPERERERERAPAREEVAEAARAEARAGVPAAGREPEEPQARWLPGGRGSDRWSWCCRCS